MVRMWHMVRCCLVVMGFTSTLTYLGPFIYIPMTIPVRLYVQVNININKMVVHCTPNFHEKLVDDWRGTTV